jgi:hypothetical protein
MITWLRETLGMYARALSVAARLFPRNLMLVMPALACLLVPMLVVGLLSPLVGALGTFGALLAGILSVLIESACWSALLASTGEVIRSHRLVLADVRSGFVAYLGDVWNVRFVIWLIGFVSVGLPGPIAVMIGLAMFTFFNAVPELIYLGRYGTAELLAASYRFIGERWIEWFPLNALLLVLVIAVNAVVLGLGMGEGARMPGDAAMAAALGITAVWLAFAMLVRGVLFLELTESSRRARAFRRAAGV